MGTRLKRVTNKIFGSTASTVGSVETGAEIGQFGSAKLGTYNATADVEEIQNLSAWNKGWIDAVIPSQQYPTLPEMTGVNKVMSYQTGYLHQEGMSEWDSSTEYFINSLTKHTPKTDTQYVTADIGESTGITDVTVDSETFLSQISADGEYTFTYNGANWLYGDIVTNLTLYGITVTGTAVNGDEIVVTVETITSYGKTKVYISTVDNNIGNEPSEESGAWQIFSFGSTLPPSEDGYLNCDNGVLSWKKIQQGYVFPFSSIYGNYDNATGYPDLISYSGSTASFKVSDYAGSYVPLRCCFTDDTIKEFVSIADLDVSLLPNGTYNLYIDKDGTIQPYKNTQYASRIVVGGGSSVITYVDKYQLSDNLTKVGSPTITVNADRTSATATNFTSSNYFKTNASNYSKTNWEMQIKFQASNVTDSQPLCGYYFWRSDIGRRYTNNVNIIISSGKVHIYIGLGDGYYYTGTGLDVSDGGFDISTNNFYTLNISYENGIYTTIFTNNSDSTIITKTLTSSYKVAWNSDFKIGARTQPKEGTYSSRIVPATYCTIDLMNTYIKSGGNNVISNVVKEKQIITTGDNLVADDIWLDTSEKPYVLRKYDGTNWNTVDYVRLPQQITVSSGAITGVVNVLPYNANGWDEQLSTPDFNRQTALTNGVQFTAPLKGYVYDGTTIQYIEQGFHYTPASGTWYFSPLKGV